MIILKQIVWKTQKLYQNFRRPRGSRVFDKKEMQNIV